jgi:hypothetical protein
MRKNVRVFVPLRMPEKTIKLCDRIVKRNTALGAASPLISIFPIPVFAGRLSTIKSFREEASMRSDLAESQYDLVQKACGIGKGQNRQVEDTVYWYVLKVRGVLLPKNRGSEEELQNWGFNVVITATGGRRNVRVDIPRDNPEKLLELAGAIISKDTDLGVASPLVGQVDVAGLTVLVTDTYTLFEDWEENVAQAQSLNNQALVLLGYAEGQNSLTPNTMYYDICTVRDFLLNHYMGAEEQLTPWGYEVVITTTATGVKKGTKRKQIYTASVDAGITVVEPTITIEPSVNTKLRVKKLSEGFEVLTFYFGATETSEPVPAQFLTVTNENGAEAMLGAIGFPNTYFLVKVTGGVGAKFSIEVLEA